MKRVYAFLLVCWFCAQAGPAWSANELGLSSDGVHFMSDLTAPLFPADFIWVPGDNESKSFWVRNQSAVPAVLDVAVTGSAVDSLIRTGDLRVAIQAADGSGTSTTAAGRRTLIASRAVRAGQTERIDVILSFDPASNNQSQTTALDLNFEVRLTEGPVVGNGQDQIDSDSDSDGSDSDSDSRSDGTLGGGLPGTGGSPWWMLPSGLLGVATGWLTVAGSRRMEELADV